MASPFLYFADTRLSLAELSAARLDGDVVELGEGFIPADAVETTALRAASLAPLLPPELAASHLSAAWVHGAIVEAPPRHTVVRSVSRRLHFRIGRRFIYRDAFVPEGDLENWAGIKVTTPTRTVVDLLRGGSAEFAAAATAMILAVPERRTAALGWIETHNAPFPYKRRAIAFLNECAATTT
ncbi:hypothetical protein FHX49_002603 [Microbacterium endophyticum]|uniref:AbiEi antitoxin C-terminal domain-containing protein n=1 Tax=Microbacterium endophyticum TaxID=1526412 RepID=A0A7W4V525_9MICO|nr:type IV toxin-antitoxin system AbiEi family antitoxin [Microbacterium endophyticum]MBB2977011.1 hypothetical protein [Microbacterium endophyticum]NIK36703.1 hypothetical protein [Microbacterium endophyticum]